MGILDDVTHAGEEPIIVIEKNPEPEFLSFEITEEEVVSLKEWLASATDEEKGIVLDANVTKINYSLTRLPVRPILTEIRTKISELSGSDSLPNIIRWYTVAYSNSEPFPSLNNIDFGSYLSGGTLTAYVVLDGSLKIIGIDSKTFALNEVVCLAPSSESRNILSSGETDSLILCLDLI